MKNDNELEQYIQTKNYSHIEYYAETHTELRTTLKTIDALPIPKAQVDDIAYKYLHWHLQHGSPTALDLIFERLYNFLKYVVKKYFDTYEDREDAVQDISMKLMYAIPKYKPSYIFINYIFLVISNRCKELRRPGIKKFAYLNNEYTSSQVVDSLIQDTAYDEYCLPEYEFTQFMGEDIINLLYDHYVRGYTYAELGKQYGNRSASSMQKIIHMYKKEFEELFKL